MKWPKIIRLYFIHMYLQTGADVASAAGVLSRPAEEFENSVSMITLRYIIVIVHFI